METNKLVGIFISIAIFVFMIPTIIQLISLKDAPDKYTISVTSNTVSTDIDPSAFKEWVAYWVGNDNFSHFKINIGNENRNAYYISFDSDGVDISIAREDQVLLVTKSGFRFDQIDDFSETYPGVITITPVLTS